METSGWRSSADRDAAYIHMRQDGERHVSKFSTVEPIVNQETGEITLDSEGRIVYRSLYCIAYPSGPVPIRIRGRAKKNRRGHALVDKNEIAEIGF